MDVRWSHEGVSLRAPVRNAGTLKRTAYALLGVCGLLTLGFFAQMVEPAPPPDYSGCATRDVRSTAAMCDDIRPSFETWDYASAEEYVSARACTLDDEFPDAELVGFTRAGAGIDYTHNLNFLRMAAHQVGNCAPLPSTWREQAEREWDALIAIEDAYWQTRIERAQVEADAAHARAVFIREVLTNTSPLWLPLVLLAWVVALVGSRRILRLAEPLSLHVHTGGVELDGRRIPRSDIAFLSLEGRCLRVERWNGPPVFTRPLPPEALVHADEICGALGLVDDDDEETPAPAPAALRALLAEHRRG